jgi:hypothetical protein
MTCSAKWLRLCESEEAYRARQYEFVQDEKRMALDLKQALSGANDNLTALHLLAALKPSVEIPLRWRHNLYISSLMVQTNPLTQYPLAGP